jgi:hypothetical protein
MALVVVCSNCGWRKRVHRRPDQDHRYCPRCTSVTHVVGDEGSWGMYLVLATTAVIFGLAIFGCLAMCVLGNILSRF